MFAKTVPFGDPLLVDLTCIRISVVFSYAMHKILVLIELIESGPNTTATTNVLHYCFKTKTCFCILARPRVYIQYVVRAISCSLIIPSVHTGCEEDPLRTRLQWKRWRIKFTVLFSNKNACSSSADANVGVQSVFGTKFPILCFHRPFMFIGFS